MTKIDMEIIFKTDGEYCIQEHLQLYYEVGHGFGQGKSGDYDYVRVFRKFDNGKREITVFDKLVYHLSMVHRFSYEITSDNKVIHVRINKGTNKYK
ncbi:hypothetical protein [Acetobacterium sp.]|uniref:hypothetical protein n=1 Tax=Acetobacterium sp. TaxID=1872094 RepID=UPI002F4006A2